MIISASAYEINGEKLGLRYGSELPSKRHATRVLKQIKYRREKASRVKAKLSTFKFRVSLCVTGSMYTARYKDIISYHPGRQRKIIIGQ